MNTIEHNKSTNSIDELDENALHGAEGLLLAGNFESDNIESDDAELDEKKDSDEADGEQEAVTQEIKPKGKILKSVQTSEPRTPRMNWYVLQVYSGHESSIADKMRELAALKNIQDLEEIFVPKQKVSEIVDGKMLEKQKNLFSGYIFVKMMLTDAVLSMIASLNVNSVFLGGDKPTPVSNVEMEALFKRIDELKDEFSFSFITGETVRICDGPFSSFIGSVETVDQEKGFLWVSVTIFGLDTPVGLKFSQVEKIK